MCQIFNSKVVSSAHGSKPYMMRLEQGLTLSYRAIRDALKVSYKGVVMFQLQDCIFSSWIKTILSDAKA